ncbi:hypothetical protein DIPPA_02381 [Diplonema papillatum]|nr:hypothetical protein DIPPA_02381 [Diplonema papillatum]
MADACSNRPPSVSRPDADIAPLRTSSRSRANFFDNLAEMPTFLPWWSQSTPINSYRVLAVLVSASFHVTFERAANSSTLRDASSTSFRDPA